MKDENYIPFGWQMRVNSTKEIGEVVEHNYHQVQHVDSILVKLRFAGGREESFHPRELSEVSQGMV